MLSTGSRSVPLRMFGTWALGETADTMATFNTNLPATFCGSTTATSRTLNLELHVLTVRQSGTFTMLDNRHAFPERPSRWYRRPEALSLGARINNLSNRVGRSPRFLEQTARQLIRLFVRDAFVGRPFHLRFLFRWKPMINEVFEAGLSGPFGASFGPPFKIAKNRYGSTIILQKHDPNVRNPMASNPGVLSFPNAGQESYKSTNLIGIGESYRLNGLRWYLCCRRNQCNVCRPPLNPLRTTG
jgi:hypothetical protein